MLNHYIKRFIIALFHFLILALFFVLVVSQLLQSGEQVAEWRLFFQKYHWLFLLIHGVGFWVFYMAWPRLIAFYVKQKQLVVDSIRLKQAIFARHYLIGLFIVLEFLFQLRS